jgi:AcrR family transcriptional regulator
MGKYASFLGRFGTPGGGPGPLMPKVVPEYKAQARTRIVEAARALFLRKGFSHVTMDDIAQELGVSKGALYLYFRTKTALLVEIQSRHRDEIMVTWEKFLDAGDIAEGIAHSLDTVFSGQVDISVWHELVAESGSDPDVRAALELDHKEDARLMRTFLKRLGAKGRITPPKDLDTAAEMILMLLQGYAVRVMLSGTVGDSRRKLIRALRLVLGL